MSGDPRELWIAAGDALTADGTPPEMVATLLEALRRIARDGRRGAHTLVITTHQNRITQVEHAKRERIA